jgi:hypothetical protein
MKGFGWKIRCAIRSARHIADVGLGGHRRHRSRFMDLALMRLARPASGRVRNIVAPRPGSTVWAGDLVVERQDGGESGPLRVLVYMTDDDVFDEIAAAIGLESPIPELVVFAPGAEPVLKDPSDAAEAEAFEEKWAMFVG